MCIIIYIPPKISAPSKEVLEHCWEENSHNGGFMYVNERDRINIFKFDKKDDFLSNFYNKFDIYSDKSPFIIHMRYATQGKINLENTQPFRINETLAFAHNGSIANHSYKNEDISDTRLFNNKILKKLPRGWEKSDVIGQMIEYYIGAHSRLAVLRNDKKVFLYNEDKGEWKDGIWYSNDYYKLEVTRTKNNVLPFPTWKRTKNSLLNKNKELGSSFCEICDKDYKWKEIIYFAFITKDKIFRSDICENCFRTIINNNHVDDNINNKCIICKEDAYTKYHVINDQNKYEIFCPACFHKNKNNKTCYYGAYNDLYLKDNYILNVDA